MQDILTDLLTTVQSQIVTIPIEGPLSALYVVLDTVLKLFLLLAGYTSSAGSLFSSLF